MGQPAHQVPDEGPVPSPTPVRLHLLGQFELRAGGRVITVARAQQRLLAYLAVTRRPVTRKLLTQHLSEEPDLGRGPSALRSTLWRLPRPGGAPLVASSGSHVTLAPTVGVDLWDSESSAKHLHREGIEIAACTAADPADWSDDLLPGWADEWLVVEQESYRQLRLHALERLSDALREAGEHTSALMAALSAVRTDPLRESAHRLVIAVHLAEGNAAEALRQYHGYRRLLALELGLPPSPSIRQLVAPLLGRPIERPSPRRRSDPSAGRKPKE
jgi:DNA-binding SARP family transcriptional activator